MSTDIGGVWRTVGGRRIFIKDGEDLATAMKKSGKFKKSETKDKNDDKKNKKMTDEEREKKIKELEKKKEETVGFLQKAGIDEEIRSLKAGYDDVKEYRKAEDERKAKISADREKEKARQEETRIKKAEEMSKQLEKDKAEATEEKKEQFEIIQKNNPMQDDYHVGIRSPKDIKTWEEAMKDDESFSWGDFSKEDAEKALKSGEITIYSSYDIKQGTFVSTSKVQAEEYAGGKKVYEKTVKLNEVAWINGDEGQYAKVGKTSDKDFSSMSRQQLATLLVENQIDRGIIKPESKKRQIQARLTGSIKMSKDALIEYAKKYLK